MEFGWINVFGAGWVILMLIPNIICALKNKGEKNLCESPAMNVIEQIGWYGCIVLMWLPLLVKKFAFAGVFEMLLYLAGNGILLLAYWIAFAVRMKHRSVGLALTLAFLPTCMFLQSGILLRHWLLVGLAVLFAVGHIYVTLQNAIRREQ